MSWHAWLLDGVSPESFELQWPASTAMISLLKLNRSCPGKQEMENHEESNKFRHEPRESTPERSSPAFGLGFQALKTSRIRDTSSKPSTPVAQKRQVVMAAFRAALSFRTSMASRSTQGHLLVKFEPILHNKPRVCCEGSARIWPPRRNGPAYFLQVCAWWLPGCSGASASIEFSGLQTGTCPSLSASRHSAQPPEWQTQTWCPGSPSEPTLWAPPHCTPAVRGLDSEMWTSLALPMVLSHFTMFYPSHLGCALLSTFSVL